MKFPPMCLLLLTSFCRHGICSSCDGEPRVYIIPKSPFRYQGEALNMTCKVRAQPGHALNTGVLRMMTMNMKRDRIECPSKISIQNSTDVVIETTGDVIIPADRRIGEIGYTCVFTNLECNKSRSKFTLVAVDNYPKAVENVSCIIYNWKSITCILELGQFYRNQLNRNALEGMRIDVDMRKTSIPDQPAQSDWIRCPTLTYVDEKVKNAVTCSWDVGGHTSVLTTGIYKFRIKVTNQFRNDTVNSSPHTMVLVKPGPVKNVSVRDSKSTVVTVAWDHEVYGAVTYEVIIHPQRSSCGPTIPQSVLTNLTSMTISGLQPFTNYTLAITPCPENHVSRGYYRGDPTTVNVTTPADVPQTNPNLHPGSFVAVNSSLLELYWKPIDPCQQNGPDFLYKVTKEYDNGTEVDFVSNADDFSADLPIDINDTCKIHLQACNRMGCARGPPSFLILSNQRPTKPATLTVTAINDTWVRVSWDPNNQSDVTDYTVHWCKAAGNHTCASTINNRTIYPNASSVHLALVDTFRAYLFGVSTESESPEGLIVSTGITWSTCTQLKYGLPNTSMDTAVNYTDTGIRLTWVQYPKCNTGYGATDSAVLTILNVNKRNQTVAHVLMSSESYLQRDLPPGRYVWWIQGRFPGGLSRPSKTLAFVIHEKPNYVKYLIITLLCVAFVVTVVIGGLCYQKWNQYCSKVDEDMKQIQTPQIDNNVHEEDSGIGMAGEQLITQQPSDGYFKVRLRDSGNAEYSNSESNEGTPLIPIGPSKDPLIPIDPSKDSPHPTNPELTHVDDLDNGRNANGTGSSLNSYVRACPVSSRNADIPNEYVSEEQLRIPENTTDDYVFADRGLQPQNKEDCVSVEQPLKPQNKNDDCVTEEQLLKHDHTAECVSNVQLLTPQNMDDYVTNAQMLKLQKRDDYVTKEQHLKPVNREEYVSDEQLLKPDFRDNNYVTEKQVLNQENRDDRVTVSDTKPQNSEVD